MAALSQHDISNLVTGGISLEFIYCHEALTFLLTIALQEDRIATIHGTALAE
jgi:hypothetical protein